MRTATMPVAVLAPTLAALALGASGTLAAMPAAGGTLTASTAPATVSATPAAVPARPARTVLLVTGQRYAIAGGIRGAAPRVSTAGSAVSPGTVLGRLPGGPSGPVAALSLNGAAYEIPYAALPYLGHGLDPGLFNLASLLGAERDGRVPVVVRFGGGQLPVLPRVTLTVTARGSATGYLTASSASTFGAALTRQFTADHGRASYGEDGLFGDGMSISLAGQAASAARAAAQRAVPGGRPHGLAQRGVPGGRPHGLAQRAVPGGRPHGLAQRGVPADTARSFTLHTLTISGTGLAGQPDTGDGVFLFNADNPTQFSDLGFVFAPFYQGIAKFSVPSGDYYAIGEFLAASGRTITAIRLTVLPQFTVSGDTTVAVAEQAATSQISMVTPRPAVAKFTSVEIIRTPAAGPALDFQSISNVPQWVSPTSDVPTVGKLATVTSAILTSPKAARAPYRYDLSYQDLSGLIHPQLFRVQPGDLAAVSGRFYWAVPVGGFFAVTGTYPVSLNTVSASGALVLPGLSDANEFEMPGRSSLVYHTADPSLVWDEDLARQQLAGDGTFFYYQQTNQLSYQQGGQQVAENWNAYPLHPAPDVDVPGATAFGPLPASASIAGDQLTMFVTPFSDNTPGHVGAGLGYRFIRELGTRFAGHYEVDQDGVRVAAGDATRSFFWQARLRPHPSVIRFALDASRSGKAYVLSARTHTVWTWHWSPDAGATMPPGWTCGSSLADDFTTHCSAQPLLWLRYNVGGLGLNGAAPPGRQSLTVTASHFQPSATAAPITRASVQVSFDGGSTWRAASVALRGAGRFVATYTAPATARYAELRVSAADSAGSTVTETLPDAYRIAAARTTARLTAARLSRPAPTTRPTRLSRLRAACPEVPRGYARCFTLYRPQLAVNRAIAAGRTGLAIVPAGWGARNLENAYKLPVTLGAGQTVAVSIPFDTPRLEHYLAVYRKQFGLPPCTTANGCFRKVNQLGHAAPLPRSGVGSGWDLEATLDVSMISAACPRCHILVVEAKNNSLPNLAASEDTAARLGAQVISNSYGSQEYGFAQSLASAYDHPGHVIVVASGDSGFQVAQFPANLPTVTSAGGTELSRASNTRGWTEQVWNIPGLGATGSGCSAYVPKPAWQQDTGCGMRTSADVSAAADNIAVYNADYGGWQIVAGTSASAPFIAGVYGLAGNAASIAPGYEYSHAESLFDVTTGNNDWLTGTGGASCDFSYLCVAGPGYDAPTGLGTPDGIGAF